jgi:hypothetical protein
LPSCVASWLATPTCASSVRERSAPAGGSGRAVWVGGSTCRSAHSSERPLACSTGTRRRRDRLQRWVAIYLMPLTRLDQAAHSPCAGWVVGQTATASVEVQAAGARATVDPAVTQMAIDQEISPDSAADARLEVGPPPARPTQPDSSQAPLVPPHPLPPHPLPPPPPPPRPVRSSQRAHRRRRRRRPA